MAWRRKTVDFVDDLCVGVTEGLVMAITSFLMAAGGILGAYFAAKASISFTSDLRRDLFARVQQFSFKNIDTFSTGSLVTRLTNDIQQVQNLIMMGLRMMLRAPGMFLGALVMAFWMNAELAAVILVVIPLLTAAIVWILRTAYPRFTAMQKALDTLNSGIQEVLTNVRVVKSFVREDYEEKRFADTNRELKEAGLRALKIVIATMPVMMFAMNVTTLAVVWFGGKLIIGGLRSDIGKGWLVADKKAAIRFKRLNADDYELTLPANAPDSMNSVIALVLNNRKVPNPIRLIDHKQSNTLYTFDSELQGRGLGYGDGKPNRNYVTKWKNTNQWMKWNLRSSAPVEYTVYLDYNTQGKNDTGTVVVEIAGQKLEANYSTYPEQKGTNSLRLGKVKLPKGSFECSLKGKQYQGSQYMTPIAVRLEKE